MLGLPLNEAVEKPRLHNQLYPSNVVTENMEKYALSVDITQGLQNKGHVFNGKALSVVQAVGVDPSAGNIVAVSDPRKGGKAWGL